MLYLLLTVTSILVPGALGVASLSGNIWTSAFAQLAVTAITVVVSAIVLDRRPLKEFGLHFSQLWFLDFCFGLLLNALLMAAIFTVEWAACWLSV